MTYYIVILSKYRYTYLHTGLLSNRKTNIGCLLEENELELCEAEVLKKIEDILQALVTKSFGSKTSERAQN